MVCEGRLWQLLCNYVQRKHTNKRGEVEREKEIREKETDQRGKRKIRKTKINLAKYTKCLKMQKHQDW